MNNPTITRPEAAPAAEASPDETESCFRLIYRSRSQLPDDEPAAGTGLAEILRSARANNRRLGITGALVLYEWKGLFAQVLEGDESAVRGLFDTINQDSRHSNVEVREAGMAPRREFGRWAMSLVVEHGEADQPLTATGDGVAEAEPWHVTPAQEAILAQLRDLTRGYGKGY